MNCNTSNCGPGRSATFSSPVAMFLRDPAIAPFFQGTLAQPRNRATLPLDIAETADTVTIKASLPGFSRDNVNIQIEDGVLTIAATREDATETSEQNYTRRERYMGTVSRSVRLSDEVNADAITAELKDGELTLRLPKVPQAQPRKIQVQ